MNATDPKAKADAVRKSRKLAQSFAGTAAVLPTIFAAQGMITTASDVLKLPYALALALAGFLELALIAAALLARANVIAEKQPGTPGRATWVLSGISGMFSGMHELVVPAVAAVAATAYTSGVPGTTAGWSFAGPDILAAGLRFSAPLVGAWLWDQVLIADRDALAGRTFAEILRSRRMLGVAWAALRIRRLSDAGAAPWRMRRAGRRLDRAYRRVLRREPLATDGRLMEELRSTLATLGVADGYASATRLDVATGHLVATGHMADVSQPVASQPAIGGAVASQPPATVASQSVASQTAPVASQPVADPAVADRQPVASHSSAIAASHSPVSLAKGAASQSTPVASQSATMASHALASHSETDQPVASHSSATVTPMRGWTKSERDQWVRQQRWDGRDRAEVMAEGIQRFGVSDSILRRPWAEAGRMVAGQIVASQ